MAIKESELKDIMKTAVSSVMKTVSAGQKTIISPTEIRTIATQIAKDAESGSIDRFETALMKSEKILDKLGVDLKDFNSGLAKTLKDTQAQRNDKIKEVEELRANNIVAEVRANKDGREFFYETNILTKKEIQERTDLLEQNKKLASDREKKIIARMEELLKQDKLSNEDREEIIRGEKQIQADKLKIAQEEKILTPLNQANEEMRLGPTSQFYEELKAPFVAVGDAFMTLIDIGRDMGKVFKFFADGGLVKGLKSFKNGVLALGKFFGKTQILIGLAIAGVIAAVVFFKDKIQGIADFIMGIPGKIMDGLTKVFTMYTDFYKTMINAVIKLINKIPGVNIGLLETSTMKAEREESEKAERIKAETAEGEMAQAVTQTNMIEDDSAETGAIIAQRQTEDGLLTPDRIDYTKVAAGGDLDIQSMVPPRGDLLNNNNMQTLQAQELKAVQGDANMATASVPPTILNNTNQSNISTSGTSVVGFVQNKNADDTFINLNTASA